MCDRSAESSPRHPGFAAHALHLRGDIASHAGRFDATTAGHYRRALSMAETRGMRPLMALCHLGLGKLYQRSDQPSPAREHLDTAVAMSRTMQMRFWTEQGEQALTGL